MQPRDSAASFHLSSSHIIHKALFLSLLNLHTSCSLLQGAANAFVLFKCFVTQKKRRGAFPSSWHELSHCGDTTRRPMKTILTTGYVLGVWESDWATPRCEWLCTITPGWLERDPHRTSSWLVHHSTASHPQVLHMPLSKFKAPELARTSCECYCVSCVCVSSLCADLAPIRNQERWIDSDATLSSRAICRFQFSRIMELEELVRVYCILWVNIKQYFTCELLPFYIFRIFAANFIDSLN